MHDLTATTALGGTTPRSDTIGTITIAEITDMALASVSTRAGGDKATAAALKKAIGTDAPGPGGAAGKADTTAFWTGPDQWMVMAPDGDDVLADTLFTAVKGKASITEQTGAWVRFDVSGAARADMFERLCALPIRRMSPGDANRTRIEQLGCFVLVGADAITVLGPRASAASLHHALTTAAHSVA